VSYRGTNGLRGFWEWSAAWHSGSVQRCLHKYHGSIWLLDRTLTEICPN
jgi:hypothetical protein